ncbi:MAG: acyl-CoA dehydrogenase family protein, partial [Acidimicrobiales bacterium]
MFEWSEEHQMMRTAVRQFIDKEIAPRTEEFEHGDTPPYAVLRKLFATFGIDQAARAS